MTRLTYGDLHTIVVFVSRRGLIICKLVSVLTKGFCTDDPHVVMHTLLDSNPLLPKLSISFTSFFGVICESPKEKLGAKSVAFVFGEFLVLFSTIFALNSFFDRGLVS